MLEISPKDPVTGESAPGVRPVDPARIERAGVDAPAPQRNVLRRHPIVSAAFAVLLIAAAVAWVLWWLNARNYRLTDDAFIDARSVSISSLLTGAIVKVAVTDNQLVDTDAPLFEIDSRDFQAAVAQAEAQVEQNRRNVANLDAQLAAQKARIDQAEEQVSQLQAAQMFADQENARFQDLLRRNAGTTQQAQQGSSNLRQAQANLGSARANLEVTKLQMPVWETQRQAAMAQVAQAEAALSLAKANLDRTTIRAPEPGRATKISAAIGATAVPGQVLMIFVPERKWVTANFKETDLDLMRPGQPVDISIDAYPGRVFRGHIDSIQAGTGAAFSLLPPENATGNFVKVVQRVPVKITFDAVPEVYIGPGMSVVPKVKVR